MDAKNEKQVMVFNEVLFECDRQYSKPGGWSEDHDDSHSIEDFTKFISNYATWAGQKGSQGKIQEARKRLVQTAALAVQCILSIDRRADPTSGDER